MFLRQGLRQGLNSLGVGRVNPLALEEKYGQCGITQRLVGQTDISERIFCDEHKQFYSDLPRFEHAKTLYWDGAIQSFAQFPDDTDRLGINVVDPLRDRRLVEYVMAIPAYVLGQPGRYTYSKQILRNAMRGRLPETVRLRRDKPIFDRAVARRFCEYEWKKCSQF